MKVGLFMSAEEMSNLPVSQCMRVSDFLALKVHESDLMNLQLQKNRPAPTFRIENQVTLCLINYSPKKSWLRELKFIKLRLHKNKFYGSLCSISEISFL